MQGKTTKSNSIRTKKINKLIIVTNNPLYTKLRYSSKIKKQQYAYALSRTHIKLRRLLTYYYIIKNHKYKIYPLLKVTRKKYKELNDTLIRSYSLIATFLASSVAFIVSFNSSSLRILDLSPPNILDDATSSFSALECKESISDIRVCTVSKALERSENAPLTANISPRYSWNVSCNT